MFSEPWREAIAGSGVAIRPPAPVQDAQGGLAVLSARRMLRAYVEQIDFEILRHLRMPGFLLPALVFPALVYAMFLYAYGASQDAGDAAFWLANYASFAAIVPGLYLFCISAATDGDGGYTLLQTLLPVPAGAPLIGKLALAALSSALSVGFLLAISWIMGAALPPASNAVLLVATAAACTLPFCCLGMLIGRLLRGKAAIAAVNILLLPLVFLSGLLMPQPLLPDLLQTVTIFSPGHDVLMLALSAVRPDLPASAWHAVYLLLFALIMGGLAQWGLRHRD
jgi:ABC-2 type transport system permease protein